MSSVRWPMVAATAIAALCVLPWALSNYVVNSQATTSTLLDGIDDSDFAPRTFRIDYERSQFLLDGQPFRYVGGSFHYFRALPETWRAKLRAMRAAGLTVVTTYVEWSLHNPRDDDSYVWTGIADVQRFVRLASEEGLLVVLRPGPYICAERDLGGFPFWLLTKYPAIALRTMDADYRREVHKWYAQLMPRMWTLLYENGGPIIMVQVENEYGSYRCDPQFRLWMRNETERFVRGKAALFTNDGPSQTACGKIPGVLATLDFGAGDEATVRRNWAQLRRSQPNGPLLNSEYYTGWLTHWQEPMARVTSRTVARTLRVMLAQNASVNLYMFYGGTNFGFTAGANTLGAGKYNADLTSYDYDAALDEAGDPTDKYHELRAVIGEFVPLPDDVLPPQPLPKLALAEPVLMERIGALLDARGRRHLARPYRVASERPSVTFEELGQYSGFLLYETALPVKFAADPSVLAVERLHDRATVLIDQRYIGTLSRENLANELPISARPAPAKRTLQLLVENQGRINFEVMEDFKGILSNVTLNRKPLVNWTISGYAFDDHSGLDAMIAEATGQEERSGRPCDNGELSVFAGSFELDDQSQPVLYDTYLDTNGWGKGVAFVNGYNLGRYWPLVGPQRTLYVPRQWLRYGTNRVTFVELQHCPLEAAIRFVDKPQLDSF